MLPPNGGAVAGSFGRIPPGLLEGLPPEFLDVLAEIGQFVDLDGDGTPDVAVVPLQGNAMANMSSAAVRLPNLTRGA